MTQAAAAAPQGPQGVVTKISSSTGSVTTSEEFEGREVAGNVLVVGGLAKLDPIAANPNDEKLHVGDIVTIQLDVKVTGITFDQDKKTGILSRFQKVRPVEGQALVTGVVRGKP